MRVFVCVSLDEDTHRRWLECRLCRGSIPVRNSSKELKHVCLLRSKRSITCFQNLSWQCGIPHCTYTGEYVQCEERLTGYLEARQGPKSSFLLHYKSLSTVHTLYIYTLQVLSTFPVLVLSFHLPPLWLWAKTLASEETLGSIIFDLKDKCLTSNFKISINGLRLIRMINETLHNAHMGCSHR